ncbi:MAG: RNase P modulator RnpM [Janthinobacterium lividum]
MKVRRVPIRSCVVCRQTSDKKTLLRVVRAPEKDGGAVAADPSGRANGRGAYICAALECIEKAAKQKRFERSLSAPVPATLTEELKALAAKIAETNITEIQAQAAVQNTGATAL